MQSEFKSKIYLEKLYQRHLHPTNKGHPLINPSRIELSAKLQYHSPILGQIEFLNTFIRLYDLSLLVGGMR